MAEETATVSETNVEDIDILSTPLGPTSDVPEPSDAADKPEDKGAATEEKPAEKATETDAKGTEAKDPEAKESPASDTPAEGQKPEEQEQLTPEQQRAAEQARAHQEYQNRQRTRQQVAQQLDQHYGPKTEDELVEQGLTPEDAKFEAFRQEMAYKEQRTQIAELNAGMQAEAVNVTNDFSIFNPNSKDYDADFTKLVETQYATAARLQVDANGIITNAEVPLYDFYKQMNDIYSRGTSKGAQQGQQEMQQMLSRTENPGGSSSTSGNSSDDLNAMEERLGNVRIA